MLGGSGLAFEPGSGFLSSASNVKPDKKRINLGIFGGNQSVQAPYIAEFATLGTIFASVIAICATCLAVTNSWIVFWFCDTLQNSQLQQGYGRSHVSE
ncbi:12056_t:CDS:2, partial [Cetraspora pellucida]